MIDSPCYIARDEDVFSINLGHNVDPYRRLGESGFYSCRDTVGVKWTYKGEEYTFRAPVLENNPYTDLAAYPTPDMQYMVVVYEDPESGIIKPDNAVVLTATGERHCQLHCPNPERLAGFEIVTWPKDELNLQIDFEQKRGNDHDWMETRLLKVPEFTFTDEVIGTWRL